jgi:uncharacterized protein (DUF2236 family)
MAALYGSASLTWQLSTRWTSLLGGQRALLMQVAHPSVGAGVAEHSDFSLDPFRRLDRTLHAVMTIGFGSSDERAAMLDALDRVHAGVTGTTDAGDPYSALDPELQFWVHATLVDTVFCIERRYLQVLTRTERSLLYLESVEMARALGIPDRHIPSDLGSFRAYMDEMNRTLVPGDQSRAVARSVLRPGLRLLPDPLLAPLAWTTLEMLPRPLRTAYGYRDLAPPQLAAVRAGQLAARTALPRLPEPFLRFPGTHRYLERAA